jgi:hypothetical protein
MAEVRVASNQLDGNGRLSVRAGDRLTFAPDCAGAPWIWAGLAGASQQGWVPRIAIDCALMEQGRGVGIRVLAERTDGYLATRVGDVVMVMHTEEDALAAWAYVVLMHSHAGRRCPRGWVRTDSLGPWPCGGQPSSLAAAGAVSPSRLGLRRLKIITFGLSLPELERRPYFHSTPDEWALRAALSRRGYESVSALCDCRMFSGERGERIYDHPGSHPITTATVAMHPRFPALLISVQEQWLASLAKEGSGKMETLLAFFCTSGKHRSVAVATIFQSICQVREGLHVELCHLSSAAWHQEHQGCAVCSAPSAERDAALREAQNTWLPVLAR